MDKPIFSLVALVAFFGAQASASAFTLEELHKQYDKQVDKLSDEIEVSFHIEELGTGKVIYSKNAERALIPASGMKIVTSAVALDELGPSWTTTTQVLQAGQRQGNKLEGDLVLRGEGDPYLVSERLWLLAREVARSGIVEISGGIKVDQTYFDSDPGDLLSLGKGQPYAAKLAPTSLNFNSVEIHIQGREVDGKPFVEFGPLPHNYAELKNDVKIVSGTRRSVYAESLGMKNGKEVFRVFGEIGRNAKPDVVYISVEDPSAYIANVFAAMLRREGIKLGKDYAGLEAKKASGAIVAQLESLPILDLIRLANTYSNNFMAEQIFRIIGAKRYDAPATKDKAIRVADAYLSQIPDCKNGSKVTNGSGLSWDGRISSLCFVRLLQKNYREFRGFADMIGSMPVGASTGTLKQRFSGFGSWFDPWKVRAKTGTLWSKGAVTSLVGFVPSKAGEHFVFSVIMNHKAKSDAPIPSMRQWEDQNVAFLQKLDVAP